VGCDNAVRSILCRLLETGSRPDLAFPGTLLDWNRELLTVHLGQGVVVAVLRGPPPPLAPAV
jgi:hypothetical protein